MPKPEMKAFLIGADKLLRQCMATLLGDHFNVIGEGEDLNSVLKLHASEMSHVVLWLRVPPHAPDIASEANEVRSRWPLTRTIVLCRPGEADDAVLSLVRGPVDGLLSLQMSATALDYAVRAVVAGERLLSTDLVPPRSVSWPAEEPEARSSLDPRVALTPRQREVLKALAAGLPNKMIARNMGVAEATVKVQVRYILRKIGAGNRTQAAIWARENGFETEAEEDTPPPQKAVGTLHLVKH